LLEKQLTAAFPDAPAIEIATETYREMEPKLEDERPAQRISLFNNHKASAPHMPSY
jgi:hypothetical protein